MQLILNNPYRIIGLLVGASAREQDRQIKRLKQFLAAEQETENDYSFPILGELDRTLEDVEAASAKLTLGLDKINAALFWFWIGNPITDEVAIEALKDGDKEAAFEIWRKLAYNSENDYNEITKRNASAFHNLSTLYLSEYGVDSDTLTLKLSFLESHFVADFIEIAADKNHVVSTKELQLLFLNNLLTDDSVDTSDFIEALSSIDFIAKSDFLKSYIQKPIEQIEQKIEIAKNKRKAKKANCAKAGEELYKTTKDDLSQLSSIIGSTEIKYISITDKVANEVLQCSIDYFNTELEKDSDIDFLGIAMKLAILAKGLAIGSMTKDRINENINTLEEMKDRDISRAIDLLKSIKDAYITNEKKIRADVKKIEETDILIRTGQRTINWDAVEDNIKDSIDWLKVNDLLIALLTDNSLKKIRESDNVEQKKELMELMSWLKASSSRSTTISSIIDKYKKIPPKLPFKIISSVIKNTDKDNKLLSVTNPLYKKHTRYIGLKINVECFENKTITIFQKIIETNGKLSFNDKISPKGYTCSTNVSVNATTKVIELSGWGSSDVCTYSVGENTIEVYFDDYLIHTKKFVIDLAPSEKLELELKRAETKLAEIKNTQFYKSELDTANYQMNQINEFQLFRSSSTKQRQISEQQSKIASIQQKATTEKERLIEQQNRMIYKLRLDIKNSEY